MEKRKFICSVVASIVVALVVTVWGVVSWLQYVPSNYEPGVSLLLFFALLFALIFFAIFGVIAIVLALTDKLRGRWQEKTVGFKKSILTATLITAAAMLIKLITGGFSAYAWWVLLLTAIVLFFVMVGFLVMMKQLTAKSENA